MTSAEFKSPTQSPVIQSGLCYVSFAYDAARSIDLGEAERRIHQTTARPTIAHKRRTPSYFEYQPPPLRTSRDTERFSFGKFAARQSVDLMIYDFGAISVTYTIPIDGRRFEDLLILSEEIYDNETLLGDSRLRTDQILELIGDAAGRAHPSPVVEDYVVFHVESFTEPIDLNTFCSEHARQIAQILRAERQALSNQEIEDAIAVRLSYGTKDVTVVDWNAALLVDSEGDDIRALLDFANVELLEMRYVDQKLDRALDQAHQTLSRRWSLSWGLNPYGADLRSLAELQVDNATLFEGVNNTLKLVGDQYLARVYRMVNRRFHLDEWDTSILRKLQTLESIYEKISDQASNRRMELLEWVIIFLIAFSIALEFIP